MNNVILNKFFELRKIYDVFLSKITLSFVTIKLDLNFSFLFNFSKKEHRV